MIAALNSKFTTIVGRSLTLVSFRTIKHWFIKFLGCEYITYSHTKNECFLSLLKGMTLNSELRLGWNDFAAEYNGGYL